MSLTIPKVALIATLLMYKGSLANQFGTSGLRDTPDFSEFEVREIQRQNQLTKRILQNFLEKSLYGKRFSNPPSIQDILPSEIMRRSPSNNIQELLGNATNENDIKEILDSDETENVDSYYEDDLDFEGRGDRSIGVIIQDGQGDPVSKNRSSLIIRDEGQVL